eukprot:8262989-Pyramimonas_sp.AAC.2
MSKRGRTTGCVGCEKALQLWELYRRGIGGEVVTGRDNQTQKRDLSGADMQQSPRATRVVITHIMFGGD